MLACIRCGARYDSPKTKCLSCGGISVIQIPEGRHGRDFMKRMDSQSHEEIDTKSVAELLEEEIVCRPIPKFEFLGEVEDKFGLVVHGPAGQGKSTFCIAFANEFSKFSQKPTLYISGEQGFATTFRLILRDLKIDSPYLFATRKKKIDDVLDEIEKTHAYCVIVDSFTKLGYTMADMEMIDKAIDGPYVMVLHETKGKTYRGGTIVAHDPDILVLVNQGMATIEKTRFNFGEEDSLDIFKVFPREKPGQPEPRDQGNG